MLTRLRAYWHLLRNVGSGARVMRHVSAVTRHEVLAELDRFGLLDFFRQPRTPQELFQTFNLRDLEFTTDVLFTLEEDNVLLAEGNKYRLHPDFRLQTWEELAATIPEILHSFRSVNSDLAAQIPLRMRGLPSEFAQRLAKERQGVFAFDETLTNKVYDTMRSTSFIWAGPYLDPIVARGGSLLDIGCGSGRETAHLWLLSEGKLRIMGIDPVDSFIELSAERFEDYIQMLSVGKPIPPVTDDNRPQYQVMSGHELDFPDASFDGVFHSGVLHWTPDPIQSLDEMYRVVKPGGVIFGTISSRPESSAYFDLGARVNSNVAGFPWKDDILKWHEAHQMPFEELTTGLYRTRKPA